MKTKVTITIPDAVEDVALPPDGREIKDAERAAEVAVEARAKIAGNAPPMKDWLAAEQRVALADVAVEQARARAVEAHRAALRARLHSRAGKAEKEAEVARGRLAAARAELERLEREVAELPARIQAGLASPSYLHEVIVLRESASLAIPHAETECAEAEDRAGVERERADAALAAEVARASRDLQAAVDELRPVLDELRDLDYRLALVRGDVTTGLSWPCSPADAARLAALGMVK